MSFKKILVYIEPWIEDAKPGWKRNYIWWLGDIVNTLKSNSSLSTEVRFILGDDCASFWSTHKNTEATPITITQQELKRVFPNSRTALKSWLQGTYSTEQIKGMADLVSSKLDDFEPEVIFTITPCPFLEYRYPNAMILYRDALYCREPWPDEMTCLDPLGINVHSAINKLSAEILALPNTNESDEFYLAIRKIFLECESADNPFSTTIKTLREAHKNIVLLALQSTGHYNFYSATEFSNQFEYLCHVLDSIEENIGVIVTQHPDDPTLTLETIDFLKSKYSNFIYIDSTENYHAPSQLLLELVDGLISVSSGLCYQALLWNKPIFIIGSSHFLPYGEKCELGNMASHLNQNRPIRTGTIHWLLTHYFFSYSYLKNKDWLPNHLKTLETNLAKGGSTLSIFPKIDSTQEILRNLEDKKRETLKLRNAKTQPIDTQHSEELESKISELTAKIALHDEALAHTHKVIQEKDIFITTLHNHNLTLEHEIKNSKLSTPQKILSFFRKNLVQSRRNL
ncbi:MULTISPECIES: capsular polysaccharide export protein, LipB/KpsS family [Pseudomonas]|uniref:capsular polysaccharide export protein, LipB/KpsS family n=1 Tax=Pseudomonas TaxID=286 RepID=UPI0023620F5D|nr:MULTISPECIES: hypothetical protein [Pseudomonas]WJV21376.1 hypothetical protein PSR66_17125 [Pseudomonas chlororaphis]